MSVPVNISKLDAAKRELEHTIRLFFNYGDIVVMHLVASAAETLLADIGQKSGITSIKDEITKRVKKDKQKYVLDKLNEAYNFFKHADKDPSKLLEFYPESSEFIIWDSVAMYQSIAKEITGLMLAYRFWFYTKYPTVLLKKEDYQGYLEISQKVDLKNRKLFLEIADKYESLRTTGKVDI